MRTWIVLAALATACAGGPADQVDGLWYLDDGSTVVIQDGEMHLDSGELVATIEVVNEGVLRYTLPATPDAPAETVVLEMHFPTPLRMTWNRLDGTPFHELTRVADVE